MKILNYDDYVCKVGENAKENWELLDNSSENNIFLHLSSFPSGYVIIDSNHLSIDMIYIRALLCKNNTKYRNLNNIKICYTILKKLEKTKNVGEIIIKGKKNIIKI